MKTRKLIGICMILLGILLAAALIIFQYVHCVDIWANEGKSIMYDTAADYFFAVSKGAILIAVIVGTVPAIIGGWLLKPSAQPAVAPESLK